MLQGNNSHGFTVFPITVYQFGMNNDDEYVLCIIAFFWFLTSELGFQEAVKFTLVLSSGSVQSRGI